MSMERFLNSLRARVPFLAGRNGRVIRALAVAVVVGTIALVAAREWRLARQAFCAGPAAIEDPTAASRLRLRPYQGDEPSPLVADRSAGRVGRQAAPLQPVYGSVVFEPTQGGAAKQAEPTFIRADGQGLNGWLAGSLKPDRARPWANLAASPPAAIPALPEPISPTDGATSIVVPADGRRGVSRPRPWDIEEAGPSIDAAATQSTAAPSTPIDQQATSPPGAGGAAIGPKREAADGHGPAPEALRHAAPPKAASEAEPVPPEGEGVMKGPPPTLTDATYAGEISRLLRPIGQVSTSLAPPPGQFHPDVPDKDERPRLPRAVELFAREPAQVHGAGGIRTRPWPEQIALWEAPGTAHHPLYFEEVNLERYGYSFGLAQPVVSAAHFFGRIPALPYLMTVDPPHRCVYTLGHYRPGSCSPLAWNLVPLDPLAAAVQGGVVTGLVFLIP